MSMLDIAYYDILYQTGLLQGVKHFYLTDSWYFKLQKWTKNNLHQKYTIILYYYNIFWERLFGMHPRYVYIFRTSVRLQTRHISSIHKLLVKSTFPRHFTQIQLKKPLRYPLRQNPLKSSISPLFTSSKITTIPPKILSTHWKIKLLSNSTKIPIYNKEITRQNTHIYNSSIQQNTSKINTFTQYKIYKQYNSIEVVFFIIKISSKF